MVADSLTETLRDAITLAEAAQLFSPVPHAATVWRWATKGTRGSKLQSWMLGGKRVTTPAAVEAFLRGLNAPTHGTANAKEDFAQRAKDDMAALAVLLQ